MQDKVVLPQQLFNDLLTQAQAEPEREICGLVSARNDRPGNIYPIANVSSFPERLFEMDAKAQIDAMRSMREQGESLYAIYHSHPQGAAVPSALDRDQVAYPEALYIIIATGTDGVLELRCYRLQDSTFREVELEIE